MKFISCSAFSFLVFGLFCVGQLLAGDSERRIFEDYSIVTEHQPESKSWNRKGVDPSKVEDTLEKSSHLQNEPASSLRERGIYINQTGDIIIDARLLKNIYMQERVVTCAHCHKKVNLKNVFSHYKNTKHRFFTKIKLARGRNS